MLEDRYDVVIVGAGPAGAAAARAIRGHGLDAVIVERAKLPRYKMCSGILFPSARKLIAGSFGPIPKRVLSEPVRVRGNRVFLTLESPAADAPFSVFDDGPGLDEDRTAPDPPFDARFPRASSGHFASFRTTRSGTPVISISSPSGSTCSSTGR
jgi:phytoene dehydrogenase-like protein